MWVHMYIYNYRPLYVFCMFMRMCACNTPMCTYVLVYIAYLLNLLFQMMVSVVLVLTQMTVKIYAI